MSNPVPEATQRPMWLSGVHHLALNTDDMKATMDFYKGLLGLRIKKIFRAGSRPRLRQSRSIA